MKYDKLFALAGGNGSKRPDVLPEIPEAARRPVVWMDGSNVPGAMMAEACWYKKPFSGPGLFAHDSDEVLLFIGGDENDPENLNAEISFTIENDVLTLTRTCAVFVPRGVAHGSIEVKSITKPLFRFSCQLERTEYTRRPAQATAPKGTYAGYAVEKYAPTSGKLPEAPEGFLQLLLWLAGDKLPNAPYIEAVRFLTKNDTGPAPHQHDFDEFIGFFGTDPENPEELGAQVRFCIGGEEISTDKSCLVFVPAGLRHSPIYVPQMERHIIHFSGSHGSEYIRKGDNSDGNMYKD